MTNSPTRCRLTPGGAECRTRKKTKAAGVAAGAGIRRGNLADIYFARGSGTVLTFAGAGVWKSAERRGLGDADFAGAGHAEDAGYNLNRGRDRLQLFESGNVFERGGAKAIQHKQICLGTTSPVRPKKRGGVEHPTRIGLPERVVFWAQGRSGESAAPVPVQEAGLRYAGSGLLLPGRSARA